MKIGDKVRIIAHRVGAVEKGTAGSASKFCAVVEGGTIGIYAGPVPGRLSHEDWHVVTVEAGEEQYQEYDVPLHSSQFEPVEEPS